VVDWSSSEKMHESPHYGLGIWVEHNPKREPFGGSCIYIHEWVGDRSGTAGCTVLRRADLERLLKFLDPDAKPVLVQMPEPVAREKVGVLLDARSPVRKK
jgi:L,D-peptidoglycan transpeptidase YkuD (ErfK/YbiS/YcfS/YnhG family)